MWHTVYAFSYIYRSVTTEFMLLKNKFLSKEAQSPEHMDTRVVS